jgi:hypothetical protein
MRLEWECDILKLNRGLPVMCNAEIEMFPRIGIGRIIVCAQSKLKTGGRSYLPNPVPAGVGDNGRFAKCPGVTYFRTILI